jgi:hypothetical protein
LEISERKIEGDACLIVARPVRYEIFMSYGSRSDEFHIDVEMNLGDVRLRLSDSRRDEFGGCEA